MKTNTLRAAGFMFIGIGGFLAGRISTSSPADKASEQNSSQQPLSAKEAPFRAGERFPTASRSGQRAKRITDTQRHSTEDRLEQLSTVIRSEDPLQRGRAMVDWIDQLAPSEFLRAVDAFRAMGVTDQRMGEYGMLLSAWAKVDPMAALDYAKQNTGGMFATHTILSVWAASDPDAAIRWAQSNHEGESANPYLAGIIRGIVAQDPLQATELLTSMPRSRERGEALEAMLPHLLVGGSAQVRDWISKLSDPILRNGAMIRSAEAMARLDPAGTAAMLQQEPGEARDRRMDDVYTVWAQNNREEAMQSISSIQDANVRANAVRGIVIAAAMEDPKSALRVMDQYPQDINDRTVQHFVWQTFGKDPTTAVMQISRIGNQGERERMYRRVIGEWMDREPETANLWVRNNDLPVQVIEHLKRRAQEQQ